MYKYKLLTLAGLSVAAIGMFTGCAAAGDTHPVERAVEDAAGTVEEDYQRADEQHEDIVDKALAPLDDTVDAINRNLNRENGDPAGTPSGNDD